MRTLTAVITLATSLAFTAFAQDWYHEREEHYRGENWRNQVFLQVRSDLDNVWSAVHASDKERKRLDRTKEELTQMQSDLDQGRWDNGILNDVIDSVRKSANDDRLSSRDRAVLSDDVARLKNYQDEHNHKH